MSQGKAPATEVQKKTELARQVEQEVARQPEQGPMQLMAPQAAYRRAQVNGNGLSPTDLLALQRTVGNREVQRIVARRIDRANCQQQCVFTAENSGLKMQTKLSIGAPDDIHEQESDQVAQQAMRILKPKPEEDQGSLQTKSFADQTISVIQRQVNMGEEIAGMTPGQNALTTHELTHVGQQIDENQVRQFVQQSPQIVTTIRPVSLTTILREAIEDKPDVKAIGKSIKELTTEIIEILGGIEPIDFKHNFGKKYDKQIKNPIIDSKKRKYQQLYSQTLVNKLKKLTQGDRIKIADDVRDQLIKNLTGITAKELDDEYSELKGLEIEGKKDGYVAARNALFNTFGDLATIKKYYASLVAADFPSSKVEGSTTPVHPRLKAQLDLAKKVLKAHKTGDKTWLEIVEERIKKIGGFNIRENRNNQSELSDHSFGWAIDIDAELNPNIPSPDSRKKKAASPFPRKLVEGLTGEDVYSGEASKKFRTGGKVDDLLSHAEAMRTASDKFKEIFANEPSFKKALTGYLGNKGIAITEQQADELLQLLKENKKKDKNYQENIKKWVVHVRLLPNALSISFGNPSPESQLALMSVIADAGDIASFLIEAYSLLRSTLQHNVPADAIGTAESVAAHGFLNLPAELITALTGSDGGNIEWLGDVAEGKTKDFMHFQLRKSQKPTLPKANTKSVETP